VNKDAAYVRYIIDVIGRIENAVAIGKEAFLKSQLHQDAVLRNLHTMTETTQRLSADLKNQNPDVMWDTLSAFRNVLVHDYLGIDMQLIWVVITRDLPEFKRHILRMNENL
jgi:uncharacterized protein with HEPN domain